MSEDILKEHPAIHAVVYTSYVKQESIWGSSILHGKEVGLTNEGRQHLLLSVLHKLAHDMSHSMHVCQG